MSSTAPNVPTSEGEDAAHLGPAGWVRSLRMAELFRRRYLANRSAVPRARRDVLETLTQAGVTDPSLRANVALAVSEATGNAVRHAYPPDHAAGHVEVTVTRQPDTVTVTVCDQGSGIDHSMSTEQGAGLGLLIMSGQTRNVAVNSDETGTIVELRFSV
jgi:anti-sigma regulatory factor (Ser/Thr protein kinase)